MPIHYSTFCSTLCSSTYCSMYGIHIVVLLVVLFAGQFVVLCGVDMSIWHDIYDMHPHIYTYIHTYIHPSIHTYIHTSIHPYMQCLSPAVGWSSGALPCVKCRRIMVANSTVLWCSCRVFARLYMASSNATRVWCHAPSCSQCRKSLTIRQDDEKTNATTTC